MGFLLRPEKDDDCHQIDNLLCLAFNGPEEAAMVGRIRQSEHYINDLTLVAYNDDKVVGFVMLSYVSLNNKSSSYRVLSLAPLAVLPSFHKRGIGGSLMQESIKLADQRNEPLIVLLGHADYYPRFGFERASKHKISPPLPWPDESYMVLPLAAMKPHIKGAIAYPPAWQIP